MSIRVMVFARIKPGDEAAFEAAYQEVTRKVKGTPGHIRDELLRDTGEPFPYGTPEQATPRAPGDPVPYVLLSEWETREAFLGWERDPVHMQTTTPMRPYWAGRVERKIYDVAFRLGSG
jgi:heme-degrading monooxygenase HmoA